MLVYIFLNTRKISLITIAELFRLKFELLTALKCKLAVEIRLHCKVSYCVEVRNRVQMNSRSFTAARLSGKQTANHSSLFMYA